jgi:hypothetical protein
MKKTLMILAVVFAIGFFFLAWMYWTTPANALPSYFPGYDATLTTVHIKHGLGAFVVALGLLVFAWFESGKKK